MSLVRATCDSSGMRPCCKQNKHSQTFALFGSITGHMGKNIIRIHIRSYSEYTPSIPQNSSERFWKLIAKGSGWPWCFLSLVSKGPHHFASLARWSRHPRWPTQLGVHPWLAEHSQSLSKYLFTTSDIIQTQRPGKPWVANISFQHKVVLTQAAHVNNAL